MKKYRPHMPLKVKLESALLALGLEPKAVQWDHDPALGLREYDEETRIYTPAANDPRYIVPRTIPAHALKTDGPPATSAGSDKNMIAKTRNGRPEKFIVNKPPLRDRTMYCDACRKCFDPDEPHHCPELQAKADERALRRRSEQSSGPRGFRKGHRPMARKFVPNVKDIND